MSCVDDFSYELIYRQEEVCLGDIITDSTPEGTIRTHRVWSFSIDDSAEIK